jgi:hypothetical protein
LRYAARPRSSAQWHDMIFKPAARLRYCLRNRELTE